MKTLVFSSEDGWSMCIYIYIYAAFSLLKKVNICLVQNKEAWKVTHYKQTKKTQLVMHEKWTLYPPQKRETQFLSSDVRIVTLIKHHKTWGRDSRIVTFIVETSLANWRLFFIKWYIIKGDMTPLFKRHLQNNFKS